MTAYGPWLDVPVQQVELRSDDLAIDRQYGDVRYQKSAISAARDDWNLPWTDVHSGGVTETDQISGGLNAYLWSYDPLAPHHYSASGDMLLMTLNVRWSEADTNIGPVLPPDIAAELAAHPDWSVQYELTPGSEVPASPDYLATGSVVQTGGGHPADLVVEAYFDPGQYFAIPSNPSERPPDWSVAGIGIYGPLDFTAGGYTIAFAPAGSGAGDGTERIANRPFPAGMAFSESQLAFATFADAELGASLDIGPYNDEVYFGGDRLIVLAFNTDWFQNATKPADPWPSGWDDADFPIDRTAIFTFVPRAILLANWLPPRLRIVYPFSPPQRQFPRDDGLAISTARSYPRPTSRQFGQRLGPQATYW